MEGNGNAPSNAVSAGTTGVAFRESAFSELKIYIEVVLFYTGEACKNYPEGPEGAWKLRRCFMPRDGSDRRIDPRQLWV